MIRLWGRLNSMNVQKVLWTLDTLKLPYEQRDAGMQFGINTTPDYLRKNPNGKVPLLEDGDYIIWESQAICRYLCNQYQGESLYPSAAVDRGQVDQWLDWANASINQSLSVVFWQTLRLPEGKRDPKRLEEETAKTVASLTIFTSALAGRSYIAADRFTLADLVMAPVAYRMIGLSLVSIEKEEWKPLADWYARVQRDSSFQKWVAKPLS